MICKFIVLLLPIKLLYHNKCVSFLFLIRRTLDRKSYSHPHTSVHPHTHTSTRDICILLWCFSGVCFRLLNRTHKLTARRREKKKRIKSENKMKKKIEVNSLSTLEAPVDSVFFYFFSLCLFVPNDVCTRAAHLCTPSAIAHTLHSTFVYALIYIYDILNTNNRMSRTKTSWYGWLDEWQNKWQMKERLVNDAFALRIFWYFLCFYYFFFFWSGGWLSVYF